MEEKENAANLCRDSISIAPLIKVMTDSAVTGEGDRAENPWSSMFTLSPAPCSLDSWKAPGVSRRTTGETLLIL